jgi:hypothetical protein
MRVNKNKKVRGRHFSSLELVALDQGKRYSDLTRSNALALLIAGCLISLSTLPIYSATKTQVASFSWGNGQMQLGGPRKNLGDASSENLGPQCMAATENYLYFCDRANQKIVAYDSHGQFKSEIPLFGSVYPMVGGENDFLITQHMRAIEIYDPQLKMLKRVLYRFPSGTPFNMDMAYVASHHEAIVWSANASGILNTENPSSQKSASALEMHSSGIVNEVERSPKEVAVNVHLPNGDVDGRFAFAIAPPAISWRGIRMLGIDREGNVYFEGIEVFGYAQDSPTKPIVRKYSKTGQLVDEVQLDYDDKLFFDQGYVLALDAIHGRLYHLNIKERGPVLTRWDF